MIDIRYCLYPFARAFEIVGSHTHTYTNTLIPFHIFFHYGIISLFMTRGWYPQSYQHCWGLCSLSIFVCLKQKNRLYYRVFLPVSFFRERCSFLCVKMFFFIEKICSELPIYRDILLTFWKKKREEELQFCWLSKFSVFLSRVFITYLAICRTDMLIFHVTFSISPIDFWSTKDCSFSPFLSLSVGTTRSFFPLSSRKEVFLD